MNKIFRKIILASLHLCILTFLMTSCIEEYNAALPTSESDLLVVEGTIISDSLCNFYLTLTVPVNSEEGIKNVNDAKIQLNGTDGTHVDGAFVAAGTYQVKVPKLKSDAQYSITVTYNGDTYESDAQTPFPSVAIKDVEANQPTETSQVDVLITTDVPSNTSEIQYYRWTYKETWEVHPEIYTDYLWVPDSSMAVRIPNLYPTRGWSYASSGDIIASSSAYYSNNQIVQYKLYDIDRSDRRLYVLYSTDVCQRSLTKAEYEYETERKKISTEMGGLFTPQPSALPTNVHCTTGNKRALGFVGCSLNVQHRRLFVTGEGMNIKHKYNCVEISSNDEGYIGEENMYNSGYVLCDYIEQPEMAPEYDWTSPSCVDVRKLGCDTRMPSYWPY